MGQSEIPVTRPSLSLLAYYTESSSDSILACARTHALEPMSYAQEESLDTSEGTTGRVRFIRQASARPGSADWRVRRDALGRLRASISTEECWR